MLTLKDIFKVYGSGENAVNALNGININFRENEFVAILGHSGCGKTTLLNIIGGLDHYTSGDLIINGVSTTEYKDRDWDAYRNHSIGFIFQSYNLIPHQTVLANVELALTISGVSKAERRKRAVEALEKVGLGNQLHKKPNQMSGGQMQRVAIARALINNPDILLADEPTGALDSETSVQVMELLKEIAKDKLVIMVTHNPELAEQYATRIVRIKDGSLVDDSDPFTPENETEPVKGGKKRVSMSFGTAVSLSLNNLLTKKGRTLLTSFAGSIGIIGIALILSLSTGINSYINKIQEDTLSSYPIQIVRETADTSAIMTSIMDRHVKASEEKREGVYANTDVYEMFNAMNTSAKRTNNMADFKKFLDSDETIRDNVSAISYSYDVPLHIFTKDPSGDIVKCDLAEIYSSSMGLDSASKEQASVATNTMLSMMDLELWEELIPGDNGELISDVVYDRYELIHGSWPKAKDEVVVILSKNNELPDIVLYTLGVKDKDDLPDIMKKAMKGEVIEDYGETSWSYDDFAGRELKLIIPGEYYRAAESGEKFVNLCETESGLEYLFNSEDVGLDLKIVGFIRPSEDSNSSQTTTYLGYTSALTEYIISETNASPAVTEQKADKERDVITGLPFQPDDYEAPDLKEKAERAREYAASLTDTADKAEIIRFVMAKPLQSDVDAYCEQALSQYTRAQLEEMIISNYAAEMGVDAGSVESFIRQMEDDELNGYVKEAIAQQYREQYAENVTAQMSQATDEQLVMMNDISSFNDEQFGLIFDEYIPDEFSKGSYDNNMKLLGVADFDNPSEIKIYTSTFA
ncbi:MAG: ABC transporter ATP-binding protein, partial [Huintestinicola sp.]